MLYNMKCPICSAKVGEQEFEDENIPDDDPRLIGSAHCASHDTIAPPAAAHDFVPTHGPVGTAVMFPQRTTDTVVEFGAIAADNPRMVDGALVVDVPAGATTGDINITPPGIARGALGTFTVE